MSAGTSAPRGVVDASGGSTHTPSGTEVETVTPKSKGAVAADTPASLQWDDLKVGERDSASSYESYESLSGMGGKIRRKKTKPAVIEKQTVAFETDTESWESDGAGETYWTPPTQESGIRRERTTLRKKLLTQLGRAGKSPPVPKIRSAMDVPISRDKDADLLMEGTVLATDMMEDVLVQQE